MGLLCLFVIFVLKTLIVERHPQRAVARLGSLFVCIKMNSMEILKTTKEKLRIDGVNSMLFRMALNFVYSGDIRENSQSGDSDFIFFEVVYRDIKN